MVVDGAVVERDTRPSGSIEQLLPREEPPTIPEKRSQQLELERTYVNGPAVPTDFAAREVHLGITEPEHLLRVAGRTTQVRLGARGARAG